MQYLPAVWEGSVSDRIILTDSSTIPDLIIFQSPEADQTGNRIFDYLASEIQCINGLIRNPLNGITDFNILTINSDNVRLSVLHSNAVSGN